GCWPYSMHTARQQVTLYAPDGLFARLSHSPSSLRKSSRSHTTAWLPFVSRRSDQSGFAHEREARSKRQVCFLEDVVYAFRSSSSGIVMSNRMPLLQHRKMIRSSAWTLATLCSSESSHTRHLIRSTTRRTLGSPA